MCIIQIYLQSAEFPRSSITVSYPTIIATDKGCEMLAAYSQLVSFASQWLEFRSKSVGALLAPSLFPLLVFFMEHEHPYNRKTKPIHHSSPARSLKQSFYNPSLSGIFKNNRKLLFGLALSNLWLCKCGLGLPFFFIPPLFCKRARLEVYLLFSQPWGSNILFGLASPEVQSFLLKSPQALAL